MRPKPRFSSREERHKLGSPHTVSAILFIVRKALFFFLGTSICVLVAFSAFAQQDVPPAPAQQIQPQAAAPQPSSVVIVLDPGHGGTDNGARGENGAREKDIVLQVARTMRSELEREGYRVALTRNDDSNPSYDDRAAAANAFRDAVFISLHVSSTGTPGTVRAYYEEMGSTPSPATAAAGTDAKPPVLQTAGLVSWDQAQKTYLDASHHLADLIQIELSERFPNSPDTSLGTAVRVLRSVAAPAVAVELSSVSQANPNSLVGEAEPLAAAIGRAIMAFRAPRVR